MSVQVLAIRLLGFRLSVSVERSRQSSDEAHLAAARARRWMDTGQLCRRSSAHWDRIVLMTIAQMALRRYL